MPAWPESKISVTTRQIDNEAAARQPTTVSNRPLELTGAAGPPKPAAAVERVMVYKS
jgi:hypothetical protein